jgi:hypothetical protein
MNMDVQTAPSTGGPGALERQRQVLWQAENLSAIPRWSDLSGWHLLIVQGEGRWYVEREAHTCPSPSAAPSPCVRSWDCLQRTLRCISWPAYRTLMRLRCSFAGARMRRRTRYPTRFGAQEAIVPHPPSEEAETPVATVGATGILLEQALLTLLLSVGLHVHEPWGLARQRVHMSGKRKKRCLAPLATTAHIPWNQSRVAVSRSLETQCALTGQAQWSALSAPACPDQAA